MKLTLSTLLTIAVLVALWLTVGQGEPIPSLTQEKNDNVLKGYVTDFSQWTFDDSGILTDTVHINESNQYTQDPRIYFSGIRAEHADGGKDPWHLRAEQGEYRPHAREFWLHDGVTIEQKNEGTNRLQTPRLRVLRKENRAVNDAPVELVVDKSITTGRGLVMDLESRVAQILENVETIYVY